MSTLVAKPVILKKNTRTAKGVRFAESKLYILLADGREIGVPLSRFPWLEHATPAQRKKWHIEPPALPCIGMTSTTASKSIICWNSNRLTSDLWSLYVLPHPRQRAQR